MSQSQTPHSKFLASLLTSSSRGANPRAETPPPNLATQDSISKKRGRTRSRRFSNAPPVTFFDSYFHVDV